MQERGDPGSVIYGEVPGSFLLKIRDAFVTAIETGNAILVHRTQ
jgi:hypothetical protein